MMFLSTTVLWIVSALLSSTQVIGQQKSATQLFKGYQGETIHSTFARQTYKFKILKCVLQNEYATHIIESATFRLRTEWTIELPNQFGDKKFITHPKLHAMTSNSYDFLKENLDGILLSVDTTTAMLLYSIHCLCIAKRFFQFSHGTTLCKKVG